MRQHYICYECQSYDVYETMLVRINRLACIVDDKEVTSELNKMKDDLDVAVLKNGQEG